MRRDIKILLAECGLRQKELLPVIHERGLRCDRARLSRIVNGKGEGDADYRIEKVIIEYMIDLKRKRT